MKHKGGEALQGSVHEQVSVVLRIYTKGGNHSEKSFEYGTDADSCPDSFFDQLGSLAGRRVGGGLYLLPFALRDLPGKYHWSVSTEFRTIVNNTGMFLFILPLLILYVFLQRYFIESIERTGIVG